MANRGAPVRARVSCCLASRFPEVGHVDAAFGSVVEHHGGVGLSCSKQPDRTE